MACPLTCKPTTAPHICAFVMCHLVPHSCADISALRPKRPGRAGLFRLGCGAGFHADLGPRPGRRPHPPTAMSITRRIPICGSNTETSQGQSHALMSVPRAGSAKTKVNSGLVTRACRDRSRPSHAESEQGRLSIRPRTGRGGLVMAVSVKKSRVRTQIRRNTAIRSPSAWLYIMQFRPRLHNGSNMPYSNSTT
ncbi:hypothetical protein VTI28DRAFT_8846 [Corynascus sepedonium]